MGPRIYPSYQDTNLTAKGSVILNFFDILPNVYSDYIQITVNSQLRDITYNKVDGIYSTHLNVNDVVTIDITSTEILFKNITIYRRDYTTDDNLGDNGIIDTFITYNNNNTTTVSLTFTAQTINNAYNFEYRVSGNVGTNPIEDCNIQGLALDNEGAYILAGTVGQESIIYQTYLKLSTNAGGSFTNISPIPAVYLQGATINFGGNVINYQTQYGTPSYSLNGGQTFTTSSISFNTSIFPPAWSDMDCDITGQYQTIGQYSGSLYLSSNSGQTYTSISNSIKYWTKPVIPANNNGYPFYAITNTVGDYLYKVNSSTGVTQVTAAKAPTYVYGQTSLTGTTYFDNAAITPDSKYIALIYRALGDTVQKDFSFLWSSDSGNTFTYKYVTNGTYGCLMYQAKIAMSADGKYIYIVNDRTNAGQYIGEYWYSQDYGVTWTLGFAGQQAGIHISCSATGKYVYKSINNGLPILYISSNYGVSFSLISYQNYAKPNKN